MFNRMSLRYRIALVIFVLEACMLAGVLGVTLTQTRQTEVEFNAASQQAGLDLLAKLAVPVLLTSEYTDYQLYLQSVARQPLLKRIVLTDRQSRVVASSSVTDVGHESASVMDTTEGGWRVQPIETAAGHMGNLAVQFSDEPLRTAQAKTRNLALTVALLSMSFIALVGVATGFALTRRLDHVTRAVRRFADGDHAVRSGVGGADEIALLSRDFDHMANAVDAQQRKMQEQGEYIRLLLDSTAEAIYGTDTNGVCTFVNPACARMLGYASEDDLIGKSIHAILHHSFPDGHHYPQEQCRVCLAARQDQTAHADDEVFWRADGTSFPVEYWSHPMLRDGERVGTVVAFIDITQRKQADEQIRNLAYFDSLTGLPNRRLLLDRLAHALASSKRSQAYGALMILDLDNFKALNDTQGHDVGDRLLVEVARRLLASVREEDTVSRLGGDEYVVIVEGLGQHESGAAAQAEQIAEKIRAALAMPYLTSATGQVSHSTPSIGVTLFHERGHSLDVLFKQADVALYQAKGAGRNTIRFFSPEMQAAIDSRSAMEAELHMGLELHEFQLYYQPQVDQAGHLTGAEALLRWLPTNRPTVSPAQFIPLAEDSGLIIPIGLWVLQTACAQIKAWDQHQRTRDLQIAVNISARQLRQPNFVDQVRDCLQKAQINPARLKLELTESVVLDDVDLVIGRMQQIRTLGVTFSLDDFGTGFSSLSYLKRLPLDQVKIDQSFIRDITTDPNDAAIVSAIIAMSNSLGLQVIAEGVETEAQLAFLRDSGCMHYQGYLLGKPAPIGDWQQFL